MATVFISYRRDGTAGEARALYAALSARLGDDSVFMDVDDIALGHDFRGIILERLASCDLLLALIGKDWVNAKSASGQRRLEDPGDFVRLEIETALKRNIPVTPVLLQGTQMPAPSQLPESIRDFSYRNAFELTHNRWESDVQELCRRLGLGEQPGELRRVKDWQATLLKGLSSYLPDLVSLIGQPKTAILRWVEESKGDLTRPLIFVAISVALGFLLQLPQLGAERDIATLVASMAVVKLVALALFAGVIHLAFRVLGGRASFAATFSAYLYLVSPLYLALLLRETATLGILRSYDPAVANAERLEPGHLISNLPQMEAFASAAPGLALAYRLLAIATGLVFFGWFITCWGAFRRLHGVGRGRSTLAGIGAFLGGIIFFTGLSYIALGIFGRPTPPLR